MNTAREFHLTAYDAEYLDIARIHQLPLTTLDRRLEEAAMGAGISMLRRRRPISDTPNPSLAPPESPETAAIPASIPEQRSRNFRPQRSVMHRELMLVTRRISLPKAYARVRAIVTQHVIGHINETQFVHVAVVIAHDPLQSIHACFLRRHAMTHILHNRVCARDLDVLFPGSGSSGGPYILIGVATRSDDGRIAAPAGSLKANPLVVVIARHLALLISTEQWIVPVGENRTRRTAAS